MAKCELCGKRPSAGHSVSHSNRKTGRWWHPNVQRLRLSIDGRRRAMYVCTRCLRTQHHIRPTA